MFFKNEFYPYWQSILHPPTVFFYENKGLFQKKHRLKQYSIMHNTYVSKYIVSSFEKKDLWNITISVHVLSKTAEKVADFGLDLRKNYRSDFNNFLFWYHSGTHLSENV